MNICETFAKIIPIYRCTMVSLPPWIWLEIRHVQRENKMFEFIILNGDSS